MDILLTPHCTSVDETRIKALFKEALVEVIEENQDLVSSILVDVLEDIGLSRAIEQGENSAKFVS